MISYVLRRLLSLLPVLWAVVTIIWVCVFLLPGDPASLLAGGQRSDPRVIARIRSEWGLDDPAGKQYLRYLARLARGDLGTSYLQGRPVARVIGEAFPPTAFLAVSAMLLASLGGIGLGLLSAAHARRWLDDLLTFLSLVFVSLPAFWLGLMLILLFASRLGWLPVLGYGMEGLRIPGTGIRLPELRHLVLPAFTLGLISMGTVARITRAALLDVLGSDFIRSSAARGSAPTVLYLRHALRNALIPVVTVIGIDFAALLGGAVATEFVFAWPGLGKAIVRGIADRDLPLVEGGVLCLSLAFILVNLAVDLCYLAVDPRVRLRNS
ncbi:MAG TPA: ABC transporter permease [Candidatus Polarisedimenticolia bacterium]|nr:ABC transporter permease [Candidatus Polarisedimenticolia bacterium]